jgi:hypothetical protein
MHFVIIKLLQWMGLRDGVYSGEGDWTIKW